MIAFWIYLGGVLAIASLIAVETVDDGLTKWTWFAPILWPIMFPVVIAVWVLDRLQIKRPWWLG